MSQYLFFVILKKFAKKKNIPPSLKKRTRTDKEERPSLDMLNNELSVYWIALESFIQAIPRSRVYPRNPKLGLRIQHRFSASSLTLENCRELCLFKLLVNNIIFQCTILSSSEQYYLLVYNIIFQCKILSSSEQYYLLVNNIIF